MFILEHYSHQNRLPLFMQHLAMQFSNARLAQAV
jgi:hypothetical protein